MYLFKSTSLFLVTISLAFQAHSAVFNDDTDVFSLSLEELLSLTVSTGSLIESSTYKSPSAITVIRRDKIELSGAKNLAHLLEQYVPGLMLMTHSEGEKIGLRGHIAAENYKLLLLVNGKNVTNMVYEGVITEIDQWDLGDIDKVEVISGPGSVTYGTGAIAGVINIITKEASSHLPKWSATVANNDTYNSIGGNIQYSNTIHNWGVFAYLAYRKTQGLDAPDYYKMNLNEPTDNRFVGKSVSDTAPPQEYQADSFGRPQIKAHVSLKYGDNFNTWIRYTQSGRTHAFNSKDFSINQNGVPLNAENYRNTQTRSFILSSDYKHELTDNAFITAALTFDSQEYIRFRPENLNYEPDHINNVRQYAFAQNRVRASALYNVKPTDKLNIVTGYEFSQISMNAPWGQNQDNLWIHEGIGILSSLESSQYLKDMTLNGRADITNSIAVGKGIDVVTHSHLIESKYELSDNHDLFYAHRLDFPDLANNMFSPRLSLLTTIDSENSIVSTVQRAQRMMPLRAQYLNYIANNSSKHETLDSVEVSFTNTSLDNLSVNLRGYYNDTSAVGFTGENLEFLTDISLFGLEFSSTYKYDNIELNINHTYINPIDVAMNADLKDGSNRNNISYADYYYNTRQGIPILLESTGNGLNNWSKNISKFIYTQSFMNNKLLANVNVQVYWDYDGTYDEMEMYQNAYDKFDRATLSTDDKLTFEQQYQVFLKEKTLLDSQGAFEMDINVNMSLMYKLQPTPTTDVQLKFYVENMFDSSYRYYVSTGSSQSIPNRFQYLDKPVMLGLSVKVDF